MPSITVTVDDFTEGGFRLSSIMRAAAADSIDGLTISGFNPRAYVMAQFVVVQHVYASGAEFLYISDADDKTDADGAGLELKPGERQEFIPTAGNTIRTPNLFINTSANGGIFRVIWFVL